MKNRLRNAFFLRVAKADNEKIDLGYGIKAAFDLDLGCFFWTHSENPMLKKTGKRPKKSLQTSFLDINIVPYLIALLHKCDF